MMRVKCGRWVSFCRYLMEEEGARAGVSGAESSGSFFFFPWSPAHTEDKEETVELLSLSSTGNYFPHNQVFFFVSFPSNSRTLESIASDSSPNFPNPGVWRRREALRTKTSCTGCPPSLLMEFQKVTAVHLHLNFVYCGACSKDLRLFYRT